MPAVLHMVKGDHPLARPVIERQLQAGDTVTVATLDGTPAPGGLPAGVSVRRVPAELSYHELLDLIFAADQVIVW